MPNRLLLSDSAVSNDDDAADEAAAALATVDAEFGRTTDPVRMYMREMGTVELLDSRRRNRIAKRIEEGLDQVRSALVQFPPTCELIFNTYDQIWRGETRLQDLITGLHRPERRNRRSEPARAKQATRKATGRRSGGRDTGPDPEEVAARLKKVQPPAQALRRIVGRQAGVKPCQHEKGAEVAHG